jgi:hypothetical protein
MLNKDYFTLSVQSIIGGYREAEGLGPIGCMGRIVASAEVDSARGSKRFDALHHRGQESIRRAAVEYYLFGNSHTTF